MARKIDQTELLNSRPEPEQAPVVAAVPAVQPPPDFPAQFNAEDGPLDALDTQLLTQLIAAAKKYKPRLNINDFQVRSRKEIVGYPGGIYVNWHLVFTHQRTRKFERYDATLMPRGDFYVVLNELEMLAE